jgi:hypothetical protein
MMVELLYLPNCPHYGGALDLVREVLKDEGIAAELTETPISDCEEAREHSFPGSPTLRVNGRDIEDAPSDHLAVGFACRTYLVGGKPQGVPPRLWLERAIRAARISEEKCQ